jgi:hypothetical protein
MSADRRETIATLRLIAAQAEKLANDLEGGRLWPGEFDQAAGVIRRAVDDLSRGRS